MTQAANTFDQYDTTGNREDLSDLVHNVDPDDTPILSMIGTTTATNVTHEWQTVGLASASINAAIEGDDNQDANALTATTRLGNTTQILKKKMVVSGTQQDGMDHAGVENEMAFQEALKMAEIKLDLELSILDGNNALGNARVTGNATTAREMGSLTTYITSNASVGATGAVSSGDGTDLLTAGTDRDLTEAILTTVLATAWTNGCDASVLAVSATNKGVVSDFDGGSTRYIDTDTKKLVHSIDVYVGDFHTLKVVPCRQLVGDNVYGIDPKYLKLAEMRKLQSYDLAKTGDNYKREMVWECTLEVCNEKAHFLIADTNG